MVYEFIFMIRVSFEELLSTKTDFSSAYSLMKWCPFSTSLNIISALYPAHFILFTGCIIALIVYFSKNEYLKI